MVVTRRGALAKVQVSSPLSRTGRHERRARQLSASHLDIKASASAKPNRRRPKKRLKSETSFNTTSNPTNILDKGAPTPQPNAEGAGVPKTKPSLFGFKLDQASTFGSMPPFNPTLCYQFVSSCPAPTPETKEGDTVPSTACLQNIPPAPIPARRTKDDDELEALTTAVRSATRILVSRLIRQPLPEESRAIMEGVMADPTLRARVPVNLLEEYDAAMAMGGGEAGMALINHLIASTTKATQLAKQMIENQKQRRARHRAQQETECQRHEEPEANPLFDAVMRNAFTSCNLSLVNASATQPTTEAPSASNSHTVGPIRNVGPSNTQPFQRPVPYPRRASLKPIGANEASDDDMPGFEVESVAPTIIEAPTLAPTLADAPVPQASPPNPSPTPAQTRVTVPELSIPRDALMQTSGLDLGRILDPTSREYRCVRKVRGMLAAIRMTSGTEEAEEFYTGMQLMVFYDMVGILSTELYTNTYRRHLEQAASMAHSTSIPGPSQAGLEPPMRIALNSSSQTGGSIPAQNGLFTLPPQAGLAPPAAGGFAPSPTHFIPSYTESASSPPTAFTTALQTGNINSPPRASCMELPQGLSHPPRFTKEVQPCLNAGFVPGVPNTAGHSRSAFRSSTAATQPLDTAIAGGLQASTPGFGSPFGFLSRPSGHH